MKVFIPILIIGTLLLSGQGIYASPTLESNTEKTTVNFSPPTLANENEYFSIVLNEANSLLMKQGKPILPSYIETFTFPFGTKIKNVFVTPQQVQTQTLSKHLQPTPQRVVIGQDEKINELSTTNYGTAPYPSKWYDYRIGCGLYNGILSMILTLEIYPIKYHPLEKVIHWVKEASIIVEYEPTPVISQSTYQDDFEFVIIGPSDYSEEIARLVTHKNEKDITTKFVSLTDIYDGVYFSTTGRDNQEKIKYFIKNAIENWGTGNIMLLGGSEIVPVRETHVYMSTSDSEIFVSDLYYADIYNNTNLFSNWDTNSNFIFGEYNWDDETDIVDLYPDVLLTRIPAETPDQVTTCVNKIITYEDNPGYQQPWFSNFVVVGGDTFDDDDKIDEGEYANQKIIDIMTGFAYTKIWATNEQLTSVTPSGLTNIKNAINNGCGFIDFSGHGNTNVWATHPHDNSNLWIPTPKGRIVSSDIGTLSNGDKLPILTVEACSTAKFNKDSNCFNWAFLSNPNGGAIGTFGASALGYGYIGTGYIQGLIGKIGLDVYKAYKLDQATTFGELWAKGLNRYIRAHMDEGDYKTIEAYHAFGDPTLIIGETSQAPAKPTTPDGELSGKIGTKYMYTTSTNDPDGDNVFFMFDWGDGTFSDWVGPIASGETASAEKIWDKKGTYQVKVVAKDIHGITSVWSDATPITMPITYQQPILQFLQRLMEHAPHVFPLLRYFLGY